LDWIGLRFVIPFFFFPDRFSTGKPARRNAADTVKKEIGNLHNRTVRKSQFDGPELISAAKATRAFAPFHSIPCWRCCSACLTGAGCETGCPHGSSHVCRPPTGPKNNRIAKNNNKYDLRLF
jgi:hypothetical protein